MTLYLLPNTFYDEQPLFFPIDDIVQQIDGIIGESERATRRYLVKALKGHDRARTLPIFLLNEHSTDREVETLAQTIVQGGIWALLADAGISCIADPGSTLIRALHHNSFYHVKSVGCYSSIIIALQLSGLSGQRFCFHGYLPHEREDRLQLIRKSEIESNKSNSTQICIETPYRNKHLFDDLLTTLSPTTELCIAREVGCPGQQVRTHTIAHWKKNGSIIDKVPTVFLWA